jgi:hypothetical protein
VDDADATLLRHRDREAGFGHGVHRGRQQRNVQRDIPGQLGAQGRVGREDVGVGRDEQHVIEGECFLKKTHSFISYRRKSELYRKYRPDHRLQDAIREFVLHVEFDLACILAQHLEVPALRNA